MFDQSKQTSQTADLRSREQLAHEDAERPEIDGAVVTSVEDDLGGDVLGGAAEGPRLGALVDALAEAEVDHLDVAARVEEQVLRFEVAVNDAAAVQVV